MLAIGSNGITYGLWNERVWLNLVWVLVNEMSIDASAFIGLA